MSAIGKQEALTSPANGAWELVGRDMIRTKRAPDGSGGMIVAQFWTSPSEEHGRLMVAAPELLAALRELLELHIAHHNSVEHAAARKAISKAEAT